MGVFLHRPDHEGRWHSSHLFWNRVLQLARDYGSDPGKDADWYCPYSLMSLQEVSATNGGNPIMANDKRREAKQIDDERPTPRIAAFIYDTLADQQPDVEITPHLPSDYTDADYAEFIFAPFDDGDRVQGEISKMPT